MGAKQILDAIAADARADAEKLLGDAQAGVDSTTKKAFAAAQAEVDEIARKAELEAAETEKRRLLTAGIEARKNTLAAKRALLDRAFDEAVAQLCALDDKTYAALVTRLVVAGSETGSEALRVPAAHRDRYTKPFVGGKTQLEALNEALCAAGKKGALTLDAEPAKFRGGVLLVGPEADIDCSFEALVAAFRDTHEAEVSARLFTEE